MKQTIKDGRIDTSSNAKYTFVAGSRSITISDANFTDQDVIVIINETQKKLLAGSFNKDLIISVVGGVITYSNTLPVLATGDKLSIDIDYGAVPTEALVNEMNVDKAIVAQAIRDKGQQVSDVDNSVLMASKIRAISSTINVASTSGNPPDWHNINEAVASVNDVNYSYKYALLIPKGVDKVYLQGGNLFTMSDGISTTSTGYYTFDKTKDELAAVKAFYEGQMTWMTNVIRIESNTAGMSGNVNLIVHVGETITAAIALHNSISDNNKKITLMSGNGNDSPTLGDSVISITGGYQGNAGFSTRWIVFSSASPNPVHSFATSIGDPAFTWARKIIWLFIYNVSIQGLNMNGCSINKISFDETYRLTNGTDEPASNTYKFIQQSNQFASNYIQNFRFPPFKENLSDVDKALELALTGLFYGCSLQQVVFPANMKSLSITGSTVFYGIPICDFIMPSGLISLNLSAGLMLQAATSLSYIYVSKPNVSFTTFSTQFLQALTQPIKIELEKFWNYSINFASANSPLLQAVEMKEFILARLALYDMWTAVPTNNGRFSSNGTTTLTATDGLDFTLYFRSGMSIQIEKLDGSFETKVISATPVTANTIVLTTAASTTATGRRCKVSGLTLTFGATNLAKISGSAEAIAAQAAGWTLA